MSDGLLLCGLALSAFLSATLLPGNSELALAALLYSHPALAWPALLVASLGNTLGSVSSLLLGRCVPPRPLPDRAARWFSRAGPAALWLSWVPLAGDALPLAAGWLRLPFWPCVGWIALGKVCRYAVLAWGALALIR